MTKDSTVEINFNSNTKALDYYVHTSKYIILCDLVLHMRMDYVVQNIIRVEWIHFITIVQNNKKNRCLINTKRIVCFEICNQL